MGRVGSWVVGWVSWLRLHPLVELVARHHQGRPLGHQVAQGLVGSGPTGGEIKQQQHQIGTGEGLQAAINAQLLHPVVGGADAGGVEQGEGYPFKHQLALEQIAGGAGNVGHDGPLPVAEQVEQAGFAHIGPAHNRHPQPFAQQLALAGLHHQVLQGTQHRREFRHHGLAIEGRQILFKINPRLQFGQLIQQALPQGADLLLQPPIHACHGQLGSPAAAGTHHLANGFCPGEIQAPVEKSPLGEFPWQGSPRPGRQHQLEHPLHCHQSAMAMQLHHGFPGEAAGGPHQQQQGFVHPLLASGIHHVAVEHPMAFPALAAWGHKQLPANGFRPRPGDPHDGHAALPRSHRRGNGRDGVESVVGVLPVIVGVVGTDGGNHHPISAVSWPGRGTPSDRYGPHWDGAIREIPPPGPAARRPGIGPAGLGGAGAPGRGCCQSVGPLARRSWLGSRRLEPL